MRKTAKILTVAVLAASLSWGAALCALAAEAPAQAAAPAARAQAVQAQAIQAQAEVPQPIAAIDGNFYFPGQDLPAAEKGLKCEFVMTGVSLTPSCVVNGYSFVEVDYSGYYREHGWFPNTTAIHVNVYDLAGNLLCNKVDVGYAQNKVLIRIPVNTGAVILRFLPAHRL